MSTARVGASAAGSGGRLTMRTISRVVMITQNRPPTPKAAQPSPCRPSASAVLAVMNPPATVGRM